MEQTFVLRQCNGVLF